MAFTDSTCECSTERNRCCFNFVLCLPLW